MLILSEKDVNESLSMNEAINVMEEAFIKYAKKDFMMPERVFPTVKDEDTLLLMPCFVDDCIGLKVVTSFPSNRNKNVPVTQGVILLNDRETGAPRALMNGTLLTAIKTAAVSGVAMRHFKNGATTVGLVGTGLQGFYQLIAALATTNVKTIYLFNRSPEKVVDFVNDIRKLSGSDVEIIPTENVEKLVVNSEIIITATTSLNPVIPNEPELYNRKLVIGVGSYKSNMRELPEQLFKNISVYFIDSEDGKCECGDIIDPITNKWIDEENIVLLSDVLIGKKNYQPLLNEAIVFKTVSMALFDALIGNYVYKKAQSMNIGTVVEM